MIKTSGSGVCPKALDTPPLLSSEVLLHDGNHCCWLTGVALAFIAAFLLLQLQEVYYVVEYW